MNNVFLTAEWRKLILINYSVDPKILQPYVPYGTELDYWNDKCYVSLVGFRFINTKLKGFYIPFHKNFEEINLRFYVRFKADGEWRRGVTFIKEIVPLPALAFVANTIYKEKYVTMPTRHRISQSDKMLSVDYSWKFRGSWNQIGVEAANVAHDIAVASEAEFITEHYWGYTPIRQRVTSQYQVEHPRWQVYEVAEHHLSVDFAGLYGAEFKMLQDQSPDSVMLAEGSTVTVRGAAKIK